MYTEKDLREAFKAGVDSQYEGGFDLPTQDIVDIYIAQLPAVKTERELLISFLEYYEGITIDLNIPVDETYELSEIDHFLKNVDRMSDKRKMSD